MACHSVSPCGTWELRFSESGGPPNSSGYGSQQWQYDLIERATGAIVQSWSGSASTSPWNASSWGVARVTWDGEYLAIEQCSQDLHADGEVERILPATLTTR